MPAEARTVASESHFRTRFCWPHPNLHRPMPEENLHNLEVRIVRLETIIGDKDAGMVSDIHGIKATLEGLKQFQWKLFGGLGVLVVLAQLLGRIGLK